MGACDLQGWYFGSSPAIVVGRRVPCHRAMSYFGLCSTGEGPLPRLSSACKHHHVHIHPPTTITTTTTTIYDRSQSALHTATVADLLLPRV